MCVCVCEGCVCVCVSGVCVSSEELMQMSTQDKSPGNITEKKRGEDGKTATSLSKTQ